MADNIVSYVRFTHNPDAASGDILPQDQLFAHLARAQALSNVLQIVLEVFRLKDIPDQTLANYLAILDDHIEGAYRVYEKMRMTYSEPGEVGQPTEEAQDASSQDELFADLNDAREVSHILQTVLQEQNVSETSEEELTGYLTAIAGYVQEACQLFDKL